MTAAADPLAAGHVLSRDIAERQANRGSNPQHRSFHIRPSRVRRIGSCVEVIRR